MKEKLNNRNEQATFFNYHPHPVKKRFLAFLFAAALFVALAACNNESGGEDDGGGGNAYYGLGPQNSVYTVTYKPGNGTGSQWSVSVNVNDKISLPGTNGLSPYTDEDDAANAPTKFVGWNDGLLTYPPGYTYTITKNVTFNARWAFEKLDKIKAYLKLPMNPVLIAVYGGGVPDDSDQTSLTWKNLLLAIKEANKNVELDLSGSTLALSGGNFNYRFDYDDFAQTGVNNIRKLILPMTAKSITYIGAVLSEITSDSPYEGPYEGPFSNIEAVSGLNVNAIPSNAFYRLSKLEAVTFPAAASIDNWAFRDCTKLIEVNLPAAKYIGDTAFRNCSELYKVSLPAATSIGMGAFESCTSLASVSLPAAKYIGESAFNHCIKLTNLTSASLPAATSIGERAFESCISLTSVSLPATKYIGESVFENCLYLTSVSLPAAEYIGERAFENCLYLTSVSLPAATSIHEGAFKDCNSLTTITIAEDCNITDDSGMHQDFKTYYYTEKERVAGVYTYNFNELSWSYKAL